MNKYLEKLAESKYQYTKDRAKWTAENVAGTSAMVGGIGTILTKVPRKEPLAKSFVRAVKANKKMFGLGAVAGLVGSSLTEPNKKK